MDKINKANKAHTAQKVAQGLCKVYGCQSPLHPNVKLCLKHKLQQNVACKLWKWKIARRKCNAAQNRKAAGGVLPGRP